MTTAYRKKKIRHTAEKGLSLVEAVIVIAVVGVLITVLLPFFRTNVDSYVTVKTKKDVLQSARIGFNRMMTELKMLEASLQIDYAYSDQIQFDLVHETNIHYAFENGQLSRNGEKLIDHVQSLVFKYYHENGTEKFTPFWSDSDVWRIEVQASVGSGENTVTFRGQVSPRNIHFN
jgi:type II secretory pathway pseudopilin PulG